MRCWRYCCDGDFGLFPINHGQVLDDLVDLFALQIAQVLQPLELLSCRGLVLSEMRFGIFATELARLGQAPAQHFPQFFAHYCHSFGIAQDVDATGLRCTAFFLTTFFSGGKNFTSVQASRTTTVIT